jgi:hypothetical protein
MPAFGNIGNAPRDAMITDSSLDALMLVALESKDDSDRCSAMNMMSLPYLGSDNKEVGNVLARVARDEASSKEVRMLAYFLLLDVSARPAEKYPRADSFEFPRDVDWSIVDEFQR